MKLSIVTPAYNEEDNIDLYLKTLTETLDTLNIKYEIILVNDGSTDNTLITMLNSIKTYPNVRVINLSRNFGQVSAIMCGLKNALGDCAILMDADLQHPAKYIPKMLDFFDQGYDMVVPLNKERNNQPFVRKFLSKLFYQIFAKISTTELKSGASDFRLMSRSVVDTMNNLTEKNIFLKALYSWCTSNTIYFDYSVEKRHSGESKWSFKSLWNYMLDAVFNFSSFPLRIWLYIGSFVSIFSLFFLIRVIYVKIVYNAGFSGFATLASLVLFFGGLLILQIAITGEYISRIYTEVKNRPMYIVKEVFNSENISKDKK